MDELIDPFSYEMREDQMYLVSKEYPEGVKIYATLHGLEIGGRQESLL